MQIKRNTTEKQVMEARGGREGRKKRRVMEGGWIMRILKRGMESSE